MQALHARQQGARFSAGLALRAFARRLVEVHQHRAAMLARFAAEFEQVFKRFVGEAALLHADVPDAIILATARVENLILVTRNTKDFAADEPGIRVPYRI